MNFDDKKRLNILSKALIKSAENSDEQIEKIISDPKLFDSIAARIKAEPRQPQTAKRLVFSLFDKRKMIFVSAACLVILTTLISVTFLRFEKTSIGENAEAKTTNAVSDEIEDLPPARIENAPIFAPSPKFGRSQMLKTRNSAPVKSSFKLDKKRNESAKFAKTRQKDKRTEKTSEITNTENIFYSLSPNVELENNEYFQIVRTKLSNSSLSSLGVIDLRLGTDGEIDAEMLIDNIGRPRAIRFLNQ